VLLIDDEPMLANAYRRMLEREHDVRVVSDGHAAIALLAEDPGFDVVFCDVMMPSVSGIAVYRAAVRHRPELARRFVFMTGGAFTAEARTFLDSIVNPRLDKPIDVDTFRCAIAERLSTASNGEPAPLLDGS
jgi:CheY-like chemotaxis protein